MRESTMPRARTRKTWGVICSLRLHHHDKAMWDGDMLSCGMAICLHMVICCRRLQHREKATCSLPSFLYRHGSKQAPTRLP